MIFRFIRVSVFCEAWLCWFVCVCEKVFSKILGESFTPGRGITRAYANERAVVARGLSEVLMFLRNTCIHRSGVTAHTVICAYFIAVCGLVSVYKSVKSLFS